jgi:hypothetical protein
MVRKFLRLQSTRWGGRSSFINEAQIVWEGENYFVVRSGVKSDGRRYTWLADKVGVLLDADSPALMQIAAEWHESHTERASNPEVLHNSYIHDEEAEFTGRWCKSVKKRVIAYAKIKDSTYHEDVEAGIVQWEKDRAAERAYEKAERIYYARMLKVARKFTKVPRYHQPYRTSAVLNTGVFIEYSRQSSESASVEGAARGYEGAFYVRLHDLGVGLTLETFESTLEFLSKLETVE